MEKIRRRPPAAEEIRQRVAGLCMLGTEPHLPAGRISVACCALGARTASGAGSCTKLSNIVYIRPSYVCPSFVTLSRTAKAPQCEPDPGSVGCAPSSTYSCTPDETDCKDGHDRRERERESNGILGTVRFRDPTAPSVRVEPRPRAPLPSHRSIAIASNSSTLGGWRHWRHYHGRTALALQIN